MEQLSFLGLALLFVLALLGSRKQLTGTIQKLLVPLIHLNPVNGVIGDDLLDRLAANDRLHGDSGIEFGTVCGRLLMRGSTHFRGDTPPQRLTMGPVQKKPDQLTCSLLQSCVSMGKKEQLTDLHTRITMTTNRWFIT